MGPGRLAFAAGLPYTPSVEYQLDPADGYPIAKR